MIPVRWVVIGIMSVLKRGGSITCYVTEYVLLPLLRQDGRRGLFFPRTTYPFSPERVRLPKQYAIFFTYYS